MRPFYSRPTDYALRTRLCLLVALSSGFLGTLPSAFAEPSAASTAENPNIPSDDSILELAAQRFRTEAEIPPVLLSEGHRAMCIVGVGDTLPDAELAQLGGQKAKLKEHFGKKVTVVFLFKPDQRMSRTGLADLETDVIQGFREKEVRVVSIAVGGSSSAVRKVVSDSSASCPVLLDPQGEFFAAVGTEKLPRVYVLDADAKIVWFDIEYSQTTRRELRQVLEAMTNR